MSRQIGFENQGTSIPNPDGTVDVLLDTNFSSLTGTDPLLVLAHELFHAHQQSNYRDQYELNQANTSSETPHSARPNEMSAIEFENLLRQQLGMPPR